MHEQTSPESIYLQAADGFLIGALFYATNKPCRGNILVAGATGVQQKLYRRFALFAAQQGFNVLTFDYRGIGLSPVSNLKTFQMNYLDWGYLDTAAAVDYLHSKEVPLYFVGHSFGGHALGLLPDPNKITAACSFGSGAGWAGWMPKAEARKVRFLWRFVLPVIVSLKGYMAWSLLGMGDDLPKGVYSAWKQWCQYPHYFFDDPNMEYIKEKYAQLSIPCLYATAVDDPWAPPKSRDAFVKALTNAMLETQNIEPRDQQAAIGHMGYFLSNMEWLWQSALDWLIAAEQYSARSDSLPAGEKHHATY